MRKLGIALSFLAALSLSWAVPSFAQQAVVVPATMASVTFAGTQTITKAITGQGTGKSIYITNISAHPASTAVLTLSYGTGTNCGTGTVNFYGPVTFQAGENVYDGTGYGAIFVVPQNNDVCVTIATASAPGWISYAQF